MGVQFTRPADRGEELRAGKRDVAFLELPARSAVMIDGSGPPVEQAFAARMPGLYGTAYPLRFALRKRGIEERVGPLEGLWWTSDGVTDLDALLADGNGPPRSRETWRWTLLIVVPAAALEAELRDALERGREKLDAGLRDGLRIDRLAEGRVAQLLHVGPYATERPTIERLHAAIAAGGLRPVGRHHELYLGDPRRAQPEALKTLLRQPVA